MMALAWLLNPAVFLVMSWFWVKPVKHMLSFISLRMVASMSVIWMNGWHFKFPTVPILSPFEIFSWTLTWQTCLPWVSLRWHKIVRRSTLPRGLINLYSWVRGGYKIMFNLFGLSPSLWSQQCGQPGLFNIAPLLSLWWQERPLSHVIALSSRTRPLVGLSIVNWEFSPSLMDPCLRIRPPILSVMPTFPQRVWNNVSNFMPIIWMILIYSWTRKSRLIHVNNHRHHFAALTLCWRYWRLILKITLTSSPMVSIRVLESILQWWLHKHQLQLHPY